MDYKKAILFFIFLSAVTTFITGCSEKDKSNTANSFYVELVNFSNDSLRQSIAEKLIGKVSYRNNNKIEVLSVNYLMQEYPDMHFFKSVDELPKKVKPETRKIQIRFEGNYTQDSIYYSLYKYVYRNEQWIKTAGMDKINASNTYFRAKQFAIDQYGKQITRVTIDYSYN